MGCHNSKPSEKQKSAEEIPLVRAPRRKSDPLTPEEIEQRIDSSSCVKRIKFKDYSISYAYVCQRGYYPDCKCKEFCYYFIILRYYLLLIYVLIVIIV